jgi:hypothetical protein
MSRLKCPEATRFRKQESPSNFEAHLLFALGRVWLEHNHRTGKLDKQTDAILRSETQLEHRVANSSTPAIVPANQGQSKNVINFCGYHSVSKNAVFCRADAVQ